MANTTETPTTYSTPNPGQTDDYETHTTNVGLYVGLVVVVAALICVVIVIVLLGRRKFRSRSWSVSSRRLFLRGFSTVSQRGVLDSSASFEVVNMNTTGTSVSENDGDGKSPPKKPERRRTRNSTSTAKYENVFLDPTGAGYAIRKSVSMVSDIPFIDGTTTVNEVREEEKTKEDEELDDVFT